MQFRLLVLMLVVKNRQVFSGFKLPRSDRRPTVCAFLNKPMTSQVNFPRVRTNFIIGRNGCELPMRHCIGLTVLICPRNTDVTVPLLGASKYDCYRKKIENVQPLREPKIDW